MELFDTGIYLCNVVTEFAPHIESLRCNTGHDFNNGQHVASLIRGTRHLRHLYIGLESNVNVMNAIAERGAQIEHLCIQPETYGYGYTPAVFANMMRAMPNLTELDVSAHSVSDEEAGVIEQSCQNLRSLMFSKSDVTDDSLMGIVKNHRQLQRLGFPNETSIDTIHTVLALCPNLTAIYLPALSTIKPDLVQAIARQVPGLRELGIPDCFPEIKSYAPLLACWPHLESLTIDRADVTDMLLGDIGQNCRSLRTLNLGEVSDDNSFTDAGMTLLAQGCPQLRTLTMSADWMDAGFRRVTNASVHALAENCRYLQVVNLSGFEHIQEVLPAFQKFLSVSRYGKV
jgi:hypothetical protein